MIKMTYKGVMATGKAKFPGGELDVTRGHSYDIPEASVDALLATCEWELCKEGKVEPVKKVFKENKSKKIDDDNIADRY